jgi:hypothetical protein
MNELMTTTGPTVVDGDVHAKIDQLENAIRSQLPPVELETIHHFAPGVYARELHISAGVLLTGKIHRTRHLNIVSKGRIAVWSEATGSTIMEAPAAFVSDPGTRRVGFAYEDTVWTTIHPTDETDLVKLEELLIEPHTPIQVTGADVPNFVLESLIHALVDGGEVAGKSEVEP